MPCVHVIVQTRNDRRNAAPQVSLRSLSLTLKASLEDPAAVLCRLPSLGEDVIRPLVVAAASSFSGEIPVEVNRL